MIKKPALKLQTNTLWDYPSQHYGEKVQGDPEYAGATPSYVIWNLLQRYTREGDLVVDPMCGSGTTLDVAADIGRKAIGYDLAPHRNDIEQADARELPLKDAVADFVFVDPPYSSHLDYSDDPRCIGKLSSESDDYYDAMALAIAEMHRILKPNRYMGLYVSDSRHKKGRFSPIGFRLFEILERHFTPIDIVAVVRRNRTLQRRRYQEEALKGNFFLRGFNYLFIMRKAIEDKPLQKPKPRRKRPNRGA
jgi:DNA modification methylase